MYYYGLSKGIGQKVRMKNEFNNSAENLATRSFIYRCNFAWSVGMNIYVVKDNIIKPRLSLDLLWHWHSGIHVSVTLCYMLHLLQWFYYMIQL